jgi:hypothetical protein
MLRCRIETSFVPPMPSIWLAAGAVSMMTEMAPTLGALDEVAWPVPAKPMFA